CGVSSGRSSGDESDKEGERPSPEEGDGLEQPPQGLSLLAALQSWPLTQHVCNKLASDGTVPSLALGALLKIRPGAGAHTETTAPSPAESIFIRWGAATRHDNLWGSFVPGLYQDGVCSYQRRTRASPSSKETD